MTELQKCSKSQLRGLPKVGNTYTNYNINISLYRLNDHLLTKIYEYDNTYKELFNIVLFELRLKFLTNPSLNNYDTVEWIYRISKWKHKEPTQVDIPTIKYKHLQQIESNNTIQSLIDAIIYKANTYKEIHFLLL